MPLPGTAGATGAAGGGGAWYAGTAGGGGSWQALLLQGWPQPSCVPHACRQGGQGPKWQRCVDEPCRQSAGTGQGSLHAGGLAAASRPHGTLQRS